MGERVASLGETKKKKKKKKKKKGVARGKPRWKNWRGTLGKRVGGFWDKPGEKKTRKAGWGT